MISGTKTECPLQPQSEPAKKRKPRKTSLLIDRWHRQDGTRRCLIREIPASLEDVYARDELLGRCSFKLDTYDLPSDLAIFTFQSTRFGTLRVLVRFQQMFFLVSDLRRILKLSQSQAQRLFFMSWQAFRHLQGKKDDCMEKDDVVCEAWCVGKEDVLQALEQMPTARYVFRRYLDSVLEVIQKSRY